MEPIWNEPALTFRTQVEGAPRTYLVAGELHLGLESELARRGAYLRSRSLLLADRLLGLARDRDATRLILLGDVKHRVGRLSRQERRDVPAFFDRLAPFERVDIALGNHDVGLRSLLPAARYPHVRFHPAGGFLLPGRPEPVACLHGHAWPAPRLVEARTFLVGHTHAAAVLVDEHGQSRTEWAWFRARLDPRVTRKKYGRTSTARVIVFPPFNPLCGGAPINREGLLGPFAKLVDWSSAELVLLDGRSLGRLADLGPPGAKNKKGARRSRRR